jgi:predicted dinucleotide-binding enzyme
MTISLLDVVVVGTPFAKIFECLQSIISIASDHMVINICPFNSQ